MRVGTLVVLLLALGAVAPRPGAAQPPPTTSPLSRADRRFVEDVTRAALAEVGRTIEALARFAEEKAVPLPRELDQAHQRIRDHLARLTGAAFDRRYLVETVKDQEADVAAFRRAAERAADDELKRWAGTMLPVVEAHLRTARQLAAAAPAGRH